MARSPGRAPPGRPKDAGKHAAIIAAAHGQFTIRGFDAVTMEAVAAAARVSKMTVYSHFGDKETLFEAVVRSLTQRMTAGLTELDPGASSLNAILCALGRSFLGLLLSTDVCRAQHVLMATLAQNPDLARRFYDAGPGHMRATLGGLIAAAAGRGELTVDDAYLAADDLLSLWQGETPKLLAIGLLPMLSAEQIDQRVRRGTALFLRAYAPGGEGWPA